MGKKLRQLKYLLWKNLKISQRNKISTMFQFISSFIVCFLMLGFQKLSDSIIQTNKVNSGDQIVDNKLKRCYIPQECTTIGIGIVGEYNEWTDYTIRMLSEINGFEVGRDIKYQFQTRLLQNYSSYSDYFIANKNTTEMAIYFCTDKIFCQNSNWMKLGNKKLYAYNIVYNQTQIPQRKLTDFVTNIKKYDRILILKRQIDDILINFIQNRKQFKQQIQLKQEEYPLVSSRLLQGYDVISGQGSFYFIIPPICTFLFLTSELLKEKELKLRQYMQVVGVNSTIFWISWLISILIVSFIQGFVMTLSGLIFQFRFFLDTPFFLLFLVFFSFTFSMQFVGLFIVVVSENQKVGNSISYGFMLFAWIIQMLMSNIVLLYGLYKQNNPKWVEGLKVVLTCYAPFNFSKIWGDLTQYSGSHWDTIENRWVQGSGYKWSYLNNFASGYFGKDYFQAPSTSNNLAYLYLDILLFFALTLYFDQIFSHNKGTAKSWWFLFDIKSLLKRRKKTEEQNISKSLVEQRGILIKDIKKEFKSGLIKKNVNKALQGVNLEVQQGELLTLLGHNGAGKTTLIQIMTGVLKQDSGKINILGKNIEKDMNEIRENIGVCPQFDILWNELTAKEHLILYDNLKQKEGKRRIEEYREILERVNLDKVMDDQVGTFSGGMKRRLSMTIAGLNQPDIVFLDEPTTGMDPVSRRQIWDIIIQLKKDKVVLLTTHSMEEADILSDRIAVMVDGVIKCVDTSLMLKNQYGKGYRLNLIVQSEQIPLVTQYIQKIIPSSSLIDQSANNILFAVPFKYYSQLSSFIAIIESKNYLCSQIHLDPQQKILKEFCQAIQEWGISNSTLEEVFMIVTNKKNAS